uniref:Uncharacterized protein n=1 Tax=viral metagenome TaxID=1070528 RepID=A0A6C0B8X3_9ZZZZ
MTIRSLFILSTLMLDTIQLEKIVQPILNQTTDKIYNVGTNHSYVIHTKNNITYDIQQQLPILLYRPPHYIIITHAPVNNNIIHELVYKKDTIEWYNYKEQQVKLWSRINKMWYESCHYVYRHLKN